MAKRPGNPAWVKGKPAPGAHPPWKPGQSANPGGKAKGIPSKRKQAINALLDVIEQVMEKPEVLESIRGQFERAITSNAPKAIREYLLPFAPIVTQSVSKRGDDDPIRRMSVTQLKALAAEIPYYMTDADAEEVGPKVIDIPQDDT